MADMSSLVGKLVEICGSAQRLHGSEEAETLDWNGVQGRCAEWAQSVVGSRQSGISGYVVETFQGDLLVVAEGNLREIGPLPIDMGGFDACLPAGDRMQEDFATLVSTCLIQKGYCYVQTFNSPADREEAVKIASQNKAFESMKEEIAQGYLGRDFRRTKVAWMEEDSPNVPDDALRQYDRDLTSLGMSIASVTGAMIGEELYARSHSLIRMPFANRREEARYDDPAPLDDMAIEDGVVERYLEFCQRRRILMIYFVQNAGGDVWLRPKDGVYEWESVRLPVSPNKVLLLRHDCISYTYTPSGPESAASRNALALQVWLLTPPLEAVQLEQCVDDGQDEEDLLFGTGVPQPEGDQTRFISMCCRVPGDVDGSMSEFMSMATAACDCVLEQPHSRWSLAEPSSDNNAEVIMEKVYTRHGGFKELDYITKFDNEFFDISSEEVLHMSPAQRIVMETGYHSLVLAGKTRKGLHSKAISIYAGTNGGSGDWLSAYTEATSMGVLPTTEHSCQGICNAAISTRLASFLNLTGSCQSIDTACSSSLVGMSICHAKLRQSTDVKHLESLVLGINTLCHQAPYLELCRMEALSTMGRSFTFDDHADGYQRGEGCISSMLRRSHGNAVAEAFDRQYSLATLGGCLSNSDGRSSSLTAPNGPSQQELILSCMRQARLSVSEVGGNECHGTGAILGDPIEVGSLANVFDSRETPFCLTSRKTQFGHTEANAGIAGIAGVITMLHIGSGLSNCHLREINSNMDSDHTGSIMLFSTEHVDLACNFSSIGVSSFGIGGTNGRADIWGRATVGHERMGQARQLAIEMAPVLNEIGNGHLCSKTCPVCWGPMCFLCGSAIPEPCFERKHHCSLIREEFADYQECSLCYAGGVQFGSAITDDSRHWGQAFWIHGSWNAWEPQEMHHVGGSIATFTAEIGDIGCEQFYITLEGDETQAIYPAIHMADSYMRICGPSDARGDRCWCIQDRGADISSSSMFCIRFEWDNERQRRSITWEAIKASIVEHEQIPALSPESQEEPLQTEPAHTEDPQDAAQDRMQAKTTAPRCSIEGEEASTTAPSKEKDGMESLAAAHEIDALVSQYERKSKVPWFLKTENVASDPQVKNAQRYFIVGDFSRWKFREMSKLPREVDGTEIYEASICIGETLKVEFQIAVNHDWHQVIYPDMSTSEASVLLMGPDADHQGKHWVVNGNYQESVQVTLRILPQRSLSVGVKRQGKPPVFWFN